MTDAARTTSEVDLCDRLRDWAERLGFEVYPEVSGWDLVLAAAEPRVLCKLDMAYEGERLGPQTIHAGVQVGIHAKLRANCEVLVQALPPHDDYPNIRRYPNRPFVAVPRPGEAFCVLARRLGIGVLDTEGRKPHRTWRGVLEKKPDSRYEPEVRVWPRAHHHEQLELPPVASRAIRAGAPSPRVLSAWRANAIRFLLWARTVESFRVADLARFGIARNWADRWGEHVETVPEMRRGRTVRVNVYKLTTKAERLPDWGYADVAAEIAAADTSKAAS